MTYVVFKVPSFLPPLTHTYNNSLFKAYFELNQGCYHSRKHPVSPDFFFFFFFPGFFIQIVHFLSIAKYCTKWTSWVLPNIAKTLIIELIVPPLNAKLEWMGVKFLPLGCCQAPSLCQILLGSPKEHCCWIAPSGQQLLLLLLLLGWNSFQLSDGRHGEEVRSRLPSREAFEAEDAVLCPSPHCCGDTVASLPPSPLCLCVWSTSTVSPPEVYLRLSQHPQKASCGWWKVCASPGIGATT